MGYLKCKECEGYYELQEGERPEDFESCSCGGEMEYILGPEDMKKREYTEEDEYYAEERRKSNKGLIIAIVIIGVFLFLIFLIIPSLLVYNAYFDSSSTLNQSALDDQVRTTRMMLPLFGFYW